MLKNQMSHQFNTIPETNESRIAYSINIKLKQGEVQVSIKFRLKNNFELQLYYFLAL